MAISIGSPQTLYILETVEGTSATPTSAHGIHDGIFEKMQIQITKEDLRNVGRNGITQRVNGQTVSTIPNGTLPSFGKQDIPMLIAAGFTSASANTFVLYAPDSAGADASRTSKKTLTVVQYDGKSKFDLVGAKPTNMSLGVIDSKKIGWTLGLQGTGYHSANTTMIKQTPLTSAATAVLKSAPLSVSGVSLPYSEATLDLGLTFEIGSGDASRASGHRAFGEITSYDPKMTITVFNEDSVISLMSTYINDNSASVSWAYGSGTGNVYTWTFDGKFDSITSSLDGNLNTNSYTISPIAKADGELIRLTIA